MILYDICSMRESYSILGFLLIQRKRPLLAFNIHIRIPSSPVVRRQASPVVRREAGLKSFGYWAWASSKPNAATAPITLDAEREHEHDRIAKEEFQKGFRIIGFITLLNASLAPIWCVPLYCSVLYHCTVLYCTTVLYCCIALEYGSVYLQYG
jgi:hypothetical protein